MTISIRRLISLSILLAMATLMLPQITGAAASPLSGHVIALDAGHGESASSTGATGYCNGVAVTEYAVNSAVRFELTKLLTDSGVGAVVVEIPQHDSRSDRVAAAEAGGAEVLISIHHNGGSASADYTRSYVTQKNDRDFAKFIQPSLVSALGTNDGGIKNDGYGMTVYGSLPGVLTESYFITNPTRACAALEYFTDVNAANTIVHKEAQALFEGLNEYFLNSGDDSGDSGPGKCHPRKGCN